jgi:uncharacterized membrane protein
MSLFNLLKTVHVLAIVLWVGGMLFVQFFLRPALAVLEPPQRLRLMHEVLRRFLRAVGLAALLALGSGVGMMTVATGRALPPGGADAMPLSWSVMALLGLLMVAIFGHIRFVLYKRFALAVQAADWPAGGAALVRLRTWVGVNLTLGLVVIVVALLF